jgi:DNA-binding NarL/FixJ family response regulator
VLADLARHFEAAAAIGGSEKAIYYARRAGLQAVRSAAYGEAAAHFRAGLELSREGTTDRVELLLELGGVLTRSGLYRDSADTAARAFAEARDLGSRDLMARAAIVFEQAIHMPGLPGEPAVDMVAEVMALMTEQDRDDPLQVRLQGTMARALAHAGRVEDADVQVEVALASARRIDDDESLRAALEAALIATADPERLLRLGAELDAMSGPGADPWHGLYATSNRIRALISLGRMAEAHEVLQTHFAFSERGRYPAFQFVGHAFEAILELAAGRFDAAEAAAERAHALGMAGSSPFDAGVYGLQMFAIRREQGRLDEVAPVIRLVAASQTDQPMWRPGLAVLYADLGMLDDARRELAVLAPERFAAVPRDAVWPACAAFLADVCMAVHDVEQAAVVYDLLLPISGMNVMAGMTMALGPADRLLGDLAELLGRPETAERHLRQALALAEASESPVWQARVLHDLSRFLHKRGGPGALDDALDAGRRARDLARALGMRSLAAEAEAGEVGRRGIAGRSSASPAQPVRDYPGGLSGREVEVLRLVAAGCSNREIGERLFISQNTAANHVRAILRKTGSANRTEAAGYANRHHLLES